MIDLKYSIDNDLGKIVYDNWKIIWIMKCTWIVQVDSFVPVGSV